MAEMRRALSCMLCAGLLASCVLERADQERTPNPAAGLYTPGSKLGAGDPTDLVPPLGALGDRCVRDEPSPLLPATEGELELNYQTQTVMAQYAPNNATAVWIEDAAGGYVATLEVNARLRLPGLRCFQRRACQSSPGVDVVTSASLDDHMEPHEELTWSGKDFAGRTVADGDYILFIEVTETDKADGDCMEFPFFKGVDPYTQDLLVDDGTGVESGSLSWSPKAGAAP